MALSRKEKVKQREAALAFLTLCETVQLSFLCEAVPVLLDAVNSAADSLGLTDDQKTALSDAFNTHASLVAAKEKYIAKIQDETTVRETTAAGVPIDASLLEEEDRVLLHSYSRKLRDALSQILAG